MARRIQELVQAARALPGVKASIRTLGVAAPVEGEGDPAPLRRRTAELLGALAERLEPALLAALERAGRAWDQVDALTVLDEDMRSRVAELASAWREVGGPTALEALLALETATALVALVERRLATLVRLRGDAELTPGGRPFLDVPRALAELSGWWAA